MRLGLIARADDSGLGLQTQRLAQMLQPTRILVIDFSACRGMPPHWDRFKDYKNVKRHKGFLNDDVAQWITTGVDTLLTCETDYADGALFKLAKRKSVRTFLHYNYEFLKNVSNPKHPMPDVFLSPSRWHMDRLPPAVADRTIYLPLPVENNWSDEKEPKTYLHVIGKHTKEDRNGTELVWRALEHTDAQFELLVTHQDPVTLPNDPRIRDLGYVDDLRPLYRRASKLIFPRRFGGQSLVIQEAIASNCWPILLENDPYEVGTKIPSTVSHDIVVCTRIECYTCESQRLADAISGEVTESNTNAMREWTAQHSFDTMSPQWSRVLSRARIH